MWKGYTGVEVKGPLPLHSLTPLAITFCLISCGSSYRNE